MQSKQALGVGEIIGEDGLALGATATAAGRSQAILRGHHHIHDRWHGQIHWHDGNPTRCCI
ncbi:hypothetical protein sync_2422 [Synechococcus sp. CC9311]|nr:hypothetical protein sync_2422 [Synechococcus sp. CC9311]